jgi:hypothetical protein
MSISPEIHGIVNPLGYALVIKRGNAGYSAGYSPVINRGSSSHPPFVDDFPIFFHQTSIFWGISMDFPAKNMFDEPGGDLSHLKW